MTHTLILTTLIESSTRTSHIGPTPLPFPQANARLAPPGFQRPTFPPQAPPPQKSNLESMLESVLLTQQKQDEYIK